MNMKFDKYGDKHWYNDQGLLHREYGPAIEHITGDKSWFKENKYHRLNGPAIDFHETKR